MQRSLTSLYDTILYYDEEVNPGENSGVAKSLHFLSMMLDCLQVPFWQMATVVCSLVAEESSNYTVLDAELEDAYGGFVSLKSY